MKKLVSNQKFLMLLAALCGLAQVRADFKEVLIKNTTRNYLSFVVLGITDTGVMAGSAARYSTLAPQEIVVMTAKEFSPATTRLYVESFEEASTVTPRPKTP